MKKAFAYTISVAIALFFVYTPVNADYFSGYNFIPGEWVTSSWIFFNGCTVETCMDAIENKTWKDDTYFNLGDYNVKQGVYALGGPGQNEPKSKIILRYSYRLVTEEDENNTTDYGIVKLKNVDTEEVYYYREIYPDETEETWTDVRKIFPSEIADERLQLVFEVVNDGERLTTFKVNSVSLYHKAKPKISGTVYETVSEKEFTVDGAQVLLKRKNGKKILQRTTTDADGNYSFYPVKPKKKYKVIAKYDRKRAKTNVKRKLRMGQHRSGIDITFD